MAINPVGGAGSAHFYPCLSVLIRGSKNNPLDNSHIPYYSYYEPGSGSLIFLPAPNVRDREGMTGLRHVGFPRDRPPVTT